MAGSEGPGPDKWVQLAALCGVPLLMVLGNSMLIPVLPDMGREMGLDKPQTGLLVTAFSLSAGVGIAAAGFLADRYGRRIVMVPSLLLYGLGGVISGLGGWWLGARSFWVVMAGRVVQGVGAAGTAPVAMALVGDLFRGAPRLVGLGSLEASNGLGKVIAPILGALVGARLVWWAIFFAYAILAVPVALAVWLLTRDVPRERARPVREYLTSIARVFREKGVPLLACFWAGTVALFVLFGVLFFLSEHLETAHGVDGVARGLRIMWPMLAMSALSFAAGFYLQRHEHLLKSAVLAGLVAVCAGMLLAAVVRRDWAMFAGVILGGAGTGLQLPGLNSLITSSVGSERRAGITSLYGAVRFIGVAFGPPLYGALMKRGEAVPFWFSAGLALVTLAVALLLIHPERLIEGEAGDGPRQGGPAPGRPIPAWSPPNNLPSGTRSSVWDLSE